MQVDELKNVLEMVNDWLRFAETKNGVLFAMSISAATAGGTIAREIDWIPITIVKFFFLAMMLISALICLRSFFPKLEESILLRKKSGKPASVNPIYYGSIANLTSDEYEAVIRSLLNKDEPLDQWAKAYAQQIKANSSIAIAKYNCFIMASWFAFFGIIALAILLIASI